MSAAPSPRPQSAADRRQQSARTAIALLDSGVILIGLLIGAWQYRRVVDPIRQLGDGVRAFTAGELDRRIAMKGDAEFVALATDFNKMAQELSSLYRDLEAKVATKSRQLVRSEQLASVGYLAASVAHEINNPLGIIAGYSERAMQRLSEDAGESTLSQTQSALRVICEEAFRCKQITDRLLSLARPTSDQRAVVSLADITETVVATLCGLNTDQGRKMTLVVDRDPALTVSANEAEMKQLLLNLLINSIEAVEAERGEVLVNIGRAGNEVILSIRDNGQGMTTETLSRIFQPFYSEKRGPRRGTGLGLLIAQTIATEHGGTLEAQSDGLGAGSTFTLKLPAVN
jgi:two-component system NtrC family sensor kinase